MRRFFIDVIRTVQMIYLFAFVMPCAFLLSKIDIRLAQYAVYAGEWPFVKLKDFMGQ